MEEQTSYRTLLKPFVRAYRAHETAMIAFGPRLTDGPVDACPLEVEAAVEAATDHEALNLLRADAPNAIPVLLEALKRPSRELRWCAGFILKKLGPVAVPALAAALSDNDDGLREQAARVLGEAGPAARDAVPALVAALGDTWDDVRISAAMALGEIGSAAKDAVPALKELTRKVDDWNLNKVAVEALGKIGRAKADTVMDLIGVLLRGENAQTRAKAAELLGQMGPAAKDAAPALFEALRDKDDHLSNWATVALGKIKAEAAVPDLVKALREGDGELQWKAARALGEIGAATTESLAALTKALRAPSIKVRWRAARALGVIGAAAGNAVPALVEALGDEDDNVRRHAGAALGSIGAALELPVEPEGLELMGNEAVEAEEALKTFREIGRICKERDDNTFKISEMKKMLITRPSTIQNRLFEQLHKLFCSYFKWFEDITLADDQDKNAPKEQKLFDRRKGKPPMICGPLGWRALDLACRYLDKRDRIAAAIRRRQQGN
jgi:HEAT repeat protein